MAIRDGTRATQPGIGEDAIRQIEAYAIFSTDPAGVITAWNAGVEKLLGYAEEEWLGQNGSVIFTPEDIEAEAFQRELATAAREGAAADNRWHVRKDGSRFWANGTMTSILGPDGELQGFTKILKDRTDELKVEQQLRDSERRFRALADNIAQLAWLANRDGETFWFNRRWYEYTGTTKEQAVGEGWGARIHPEFREEVLAHFRQALSKGEEWEDTYPLKGADGEYRWFLSLARPVEDDQGGPVLWFGTNTDITEVREAERALRRAHIQLDAAVEAGGILTWVWDVQEDRVTGNSALARLYRLDESDTEQGVPLEEFVGAIHDDDRDRVVAAIYGAVETGEPFAQDYRVRDEGGKLHWVSVRGRVKYDEHGNPTRFPGVLIDISRQKHTEQLLHELNELLNREYETLDYAVSHDLRTPLRGIHGFTGLLLEDYEGVLDEKGRAHLKRIAEAAVRMGEVIDALLDMSRIPRLQLHRREVDLSVLAREVAEQHAALEARPVNVEIAEGMTVSGDPKLLRVALEHLLSNAFKYTREQPHPSIEIGTTEESGRRVYFVRDNGIGFDPNYIGKLFAPFHRLHEGEGLDGLGVGLPMAQQIISRHGGRIWAEGKPGEGTTIYFTMGE